MDINDLSDKLYHGTIFKHLDDLKDVNKILPDFEHANKQVDNGPGFYMTSYIKQAIVQAENKEYIYNNKVQKWNNMHGKEDKKFPTVGLVLEYDFDKQKFLELGGKLLAFEQNDLEWSRFILNNRLDDMSLVEGLNNKNKEYDVVYSGLADGRIGKEVIIYKETEDKKQAFEEFHNIISQPNFAFGSGSADQLSIHNKMIIENCLKYSKHWFGNALKNIK